MCVGAAEQCGVGANPHLGASATMRLVNRSETRRHAKAVDTGGIQVNKIRHEEARA